MRGVSAVALAVLLAFSFLMPIPLSGDSSAEPEPVLVTITYDWNGGEGTVGTWDGYSGDKIALPGLDKMTKAKPATEGEYIFFGWSETSDGTTGMMLYTAPTVDTTLYAVWAPSFNIVGYVEMDGEALADPSVHAKVLLGDGPGSPMLTYTSEGGLDDNGMFSVTVPAKLLSPDYGPISGGGMGYYLVLHSDGESGLLGYGVSSLPEKLEETSEDDVFSIDIAGESWTEETGHNHEVTGKKGSHKCITLYSKKNAFGSISGFIVGNKTYKVSGAIVEVLTQKGTVVAQTHSAQGEYRIDPCPEGSYKLRVTSLDYETMETNISVGDGESLRVDFDLTPKAVQTYLGYDLPHFMMIIGAVTATLLITATLLFRRYARKHPSILIDEEE